MAQAESVHAKHTLTFPFQSKSPTKEKQSSTAKYMNVGNNYRPIDN